MPMYMAGKEWRVREMDGFLIFFGVCCKNRDGMRTCLLWCDVGWRVLRCVSVRSGRREYGVCDVSGYWRGNWVNIF